MSVTLESDEDCEETANKAMSTFQQIVKDKAGFDKKNREFAAEQLLELANDWLEDDDSEDKPDETPTSNAFTDMWNLKKGQTELLCRTDAYSQTLKNLRSPEETVWDVGACSC